ncbi:hypothetical protein [Asticcacaulis sp.]|uniref:hypothetical protein n=1 Tax=Asticcacaulis sp. TaxID=1872648 RepID=UPI0026239F5F|nr:hypothetical protein [Asticcacaulis sp.]
MPRSTACVNGWKRTDAKRINSRFSAVARRRLWPFASEIRKRFFAEIDSLHERLEAHRQAD